MWISRKAQHENEDLLGMYKRNMDSAYAARKQSWKETDRLRTALQNVIDAAFQSYGEDIDRFVADLAVWKDSVERQEALERLNGLNAEQLIRTFNLEDFTTDEEDDDGDL